MLRITQELRHFESIFVEPTDQPYAVRARVFDLSGELPFAGHPVIGAAAVLHHASNGPDDQVWRVAMRAKTVSVATRKTREGYFAMLDQGQPEFLGTVNRRPEMSGAFGLSPSDLEPSLPLEVVSTGLRYLIVPVTQGALGRARIVGDISDLLREVSAEFAVLFDEEALEIRHWNNDGIIEDIATGSAAGAIGAYRLRHALAAGAEVFSLHQGRFTGRPSVLLVQPEGRPGMVDAVKVGGDVTRVGRGMLELLP